MEALGKVEPLADALGLALGVNPLGTIDGTTDRDGNGVRVGEGDGVGVATAAHSVPGR